MAPAQGPDPVLTRSFPGGPLVPQTNLCQARTDPKLSLLCACEAHTETSGCLAVLCGGCPSVRPHRPIHPAAWVHLLKMPFGHGCPCGWLVCVC